MEKSYAINSRCRILAAVTLLSAASAFAQAPTGRWDASVKVGSLKVPFTMMFEGDGATLAASIVNGDARIRSTSGSFDGKAVRLEFEQTGARLEAALGEGGLKGTFGSTRTGMNPFQAGAYCTCGFPGEAGPEIMGTWDLPEGGGRLVIRRAGDDTMAVLSRGGDEIGPLSGRFNGAFFELSYFDGSRAAVLEIEPRKDGRLDVSWMEPGVATKKLVAIRQN